MINPIDFINLCNNTFGRYKPYSGGCYKFHLLLKSVFGGEGYYDSDHIITKIGDKYYDIDGYAIRTDRFIHFDEYGEQYFKESFKEYL